MSNDLLIVTIGGLEFIRISDEWMLLCGCGDCIPLDEVVHDHCINCHVICEDQESPK